MPQAVVGCAAMTMRTTWIAAVLLALACDEKAETQADGRKAEKASRKADKGGTKRSIAVHARTATVQSVRVATKWGIVGRGCLPEGDIHQVEPGSIEVGLYDLAADAACAGTPLAKAAAVDVKAGTVHVVVPIGESKQSWR
jgi:hypothetical protein